jgi:hypothetical protein
LTKETEHNPRRVFVVGGDAEGGKRRLREMRHRSSKSSREVEDSHETDQLQKPKNCKNKAHQRIGAQPIREIQPRDRSCSPITRFQVATIPFA